MAGVVIWNLTKGGGSNSHNIGGFVSVNDNKKYYIYDTDTDSFTGEYFTIALRAEGVTDKGCKKVEDGTSSLIFNDEEALSEEMFVMFETGEKYGKILYITNDVKIENSGTSVNVDKTRTEYEFYYSENFSKLQYVCIYSDDKEPIVGYAGDSLEDAKAVLNELK